MKEPKILLYDLETSPILAHVWGLWDQNVGLNQITVDSHMLSWSAKWLGEDKVYYMDQRNATNIENDKDLVLGLKKMLDQADIVVTHNGRSFDEKVVNTRLIVNGLKPLKDNRHIDTYSIAKSKFRMTSNKLEYIAKLLKVKYQKHTKRKFNGHELWTECLKGNKQAWKEMELYNKMDTLVLEEVYLKLRPWDTSFNVNVYIEDVDKHVCDCGSKEFVRNGHRYTKTAIHQRYTCVKCGKNYRGPENILKKDRRKNMIRSV